MSFESSGFLKIWTFTHWHDTEIFHCFFADDSLWSLQLSEWGMKVYVCKLCGRNFGGTTDVRRHCLTHTGEKPFHCVFCQKGFRRKHHLESHVRRKHKLETTDTHMKNWSINYDGFSNNKHGRGWMWSLREKGFGENIIWSHMWEENIGWRLQTRIWKTCPNNIDGFSNDKNGRSCLNVELVEKGFQGKHQMEWHVKLKHWLKTYIDRQTYIYKT